MTLKRRTTRRPLDHSRPVQNLTNAQPLLNLSAAGPGLPFYTPTFRPRTVRLRFDLQF